MVGVIFNFLLALVFMGSVIYVNVTLFKVRDILPDMGVKKRDVLMYNMLLLVVPFQLLIILATIAEVSSFTFPFHGQWLHVLMWVSRITFDIFLTHFFILGVKNWKLEGRKKYVLAPTNNLWTFMLGIIVLVLVLTDVFIILYGLATGNWLSEQVSIVSKYF